MPGGLANKPKIFRGAFVEVGLSLPPLVVVFQFNPLELKRLRSQTFSVPGVSRGGEAGSDLTLRDFHQSFDRLLDVRDAQKVTVSPESLSFDIRLDATDRLNDADPIAEELGISPQLSALELMVLPKSESVLGGLLEPLLPQGFSFTCREKPPMILFIWGRKRVLPVNITKLSISETEFSTQLDPIRATVSVEMTVIEGPNGPYQYSRGIKEAMAGIHLATLSLTDVRDVFMPE
jgi:hypothetical protein